MLTSKKAYKHYNIERFIYLLLIISKCIWFSNLIDIEEINLLRKLKIHFVWKLELLAVKFQCFRKLSCIMTVLLYYSF